MNRNMLQLAYIGDCVYKLYIRKYLIEKGIAKVKELQSESIKYVSAKSQCNYVKELIDKNILTEDVYLLAADVSGEDVISPLDYVKVKNHILKGGK